jgi:putative ABC transport system ATP-binding protein
MAVFGSTSKNLEDRDIRAGAPAERSATPLAIDVRKVVKRFGDGPLAFQALTDVDFQVKRGELVMLVGPSGSGKTTLLSIMGCVLRATSGEVNLFGQDVARLKDGDLPAFRSAVIGFVFQGHNLLGSLSARENIAMVARLRGVPKRQALVEADKLLEQVGLADKRKRFPNELSGGQRQRVAIARALAGDPPLVFADEPTAALDAVTGHEVTELLVNLAKVHGSTVVVVTHDNRIFHLADRIVGIEDGRIVEGEIHGVSGAVAQGARP